MSSSAWKKFEQYICSMFGGKRRGADYGDQFGGKNDCICTSGWSIEVKSWAHPSWTAMLSDARKAVARKENPDDIAIAVFHWKGHPRLQNTLVAMTLEEFKEHFL